MGMIKKFLVGAAMAASMVTAAQAAPITVAGITWDPDAATDFSSQSINLRQFISATTGELSGFGIITAFNGVGQDTFAPGRELTFQFSGFMPTVANAIPSTSGQTVLYTGGIINVYSGVKEIANPNDYNALTFANTGNGDLFLRLANAGTFVGTLIGSAANGLLSGLGTLNVIGGLAASNFDTNTIDGADLSLTTSLSFHHAANVRDVSGTGNFAGNTVPEPGSLALLGLGLVGAAFARRRKLSK